MSAEKVEALTPEEEARQRAIADADAFLESKLEQAEANIALYNGKADECTERAKEKAERHPKLADEIRKLGKEAADEQIKIGKFRRDQRVKAARKYHKDTLEALK